MLEPSSRSGVKYSQPQLLPSSRRASAGTIKHLSLTCQDSLLETVGLDRIDDYPVLTAMLSLRAAPKGMLLCTKQETLGQENCFPHLTPQLAGFSVISLGCWGQAAETQTP